MSTCAVSMRSSRNTSGSVRPTRTSQCRGAYAYPCPLDRFPAVWHDPRTEAVERKRMVALLIEDVTLIRGQKIDIHVRFRGGQSITYHERPKPIAFVRKTLPAVIDKLDQLLDTCSDRRLLCN